MFFLRPTLVLPREYSWLCAMWKTQAQWRRRRSVHVYPSSVAIFISAQVVTVH